MNFEQKTFVVYSIDEVYGGKNMADRYLVRLIMDLTPINGEIAEKSKKGKPNGTPISIMGTKSEIKERLAFEIDRLSFKIDDLMNEKE
jgi:hypothetical protein